MQEPGDRPKSLTLAQYAAKLIVAEARDKPKYTQAERIFLKFGGQKRLAEALKRIGITKNVTTFYKWVYPRSRGGTDGLIPTQRWPEIIKAARSEGIIITPEDMQVR